MSESTDTLSYDDIVTALRAYLQWKRTGTLLTDQQADIDRCIKYGENMFYKGIKLPGEQSIHQWSFLDKNATLAIVADTSTYTLPDDFGGFVVPWLTLSGNLLGHPVKLTTLERINALTQGNPGLTAQWPEMAAVYNGTRDQTTGSRYGISLFPTPSADSTLGGRYYSMPAAMVDTSAEFPFGGQPHGYTILEAVLAAAEKHINDEPEGLHYHEFLRLMADSIAFDRARMTPSYFGRNVDRSQGCRDYYDRRHYGRGITYNP